jgi:transposase
MAEQKNIAGAGFDLEILRVKDDDDATRKLLMLIEGTYGIGVKASCAKYGYSQQRYYQMLAKFKQDGMDGLINKKPGPQKNSKRTETVSKQILRLRFLNPRDSAAVIAQKLSQQGHPVSVRSVERTITEYGIQKKTVINSTQNKKLKPF